MDLSIRSLSFCEYSIYRYFQSGLDGERISKYDSGFALEVESTTNVINGGIGRSVRNTPYLVHG